MARMGSSDQYVDVSVHHDVRRPHDGRLTTHSEAGDQAARVSSSRRGTLSSRIAVTRPMPPIMLPKADHTKATSHVPTPKSAPAIIAANMNSESRMQWNSC